MASVKTCLEIPPSERTDGQLNHVSILFTLIYFNAIYHFRHVKLLLEKRSIGRVNDINTFPRKNVFTFSLFFLFRIIALRLA